VVLPRGNPQYRERTADGRDVGPVYANPTIPLVDIDMWLDGERDYVAIAAAFERDAIRERREEQGASMPEKTARVLISYSHDRPAHEGRVLDLANRLRDDGIDAMIDQYEQSPPEGWPAWCEAEIDKADFVLMVCTETYLRRVNGQDEPGKGHGVLWEARLISAAAL
jgi:hypothetical protein